MKPQPRPSPAASQPGTWTDTRREPLDRGLFPYIWAFSRREQIHILVLIVASLPFYFLSLDIPKQIVNGPIQGAGFATADVTKRVLVLDNLLPRWLVPGDFHLFRGFELDRWGYLVTLSTAFLALVLINGAFKYFINTMKGKLGERMLRRLRYDLIDRVLRFSPQRAQQLKGPEVASMIKDEVEPLGGFIGDAYVVPMLLVSQVITAAIFMVIQSPWLGLSALVALNAQLLIIPKLRARLLVLGRERQRTSRALAGRIGELVDGIAEVHVNDASNRERADFSHRLGVIYEIRFKIYEWKFLVKFINNLIAQLPPFVFYLIGGALVLSGSLDVGQLVAVLVAYKDLPGPIKELIDWDQQRQDMQLKYVQVVEQFAAERIMPRDLQAVPAPPGPAVITPVTISGLAVAADGAVEPMKDLNLAFAPGERVAAIGEIGAGAGTLGLALARLVDPTRGNIRLNEHRLEALAQSVTGRRAAVVPEEPYLYQGSISEALLYGLTYEPTVPQREPEEPVARKAWRDALLSGNLPLRLGPDWVHHKAAGASDKASLAARIREVLHVADLEDDILDIGLRTRISAKDRPELVAAILALRHSMAETLSSGALARLVVPFRPDEYNDQGTIAENLLFGVLRDAAGVSVEPAHATDIVEALKASNLWAELIQVGRARAETAVAIFGDLEDDDPILKRQVIIDAEMLPAYRLAVQRLDAETGPASASDDERLFIGLAMSYVEPHHRLGLLTPALRAAVLADRSRLRSLLSERHGGRFSPTDPHSYNEALTVEENIVFGQIVRGIAEGPQQVRQHLRRSLEASGSLMSIIELGLDLDVGPAGRRLSASQRQKISLARALLKRPQMLIVVRGLAGLNARRQQEIVRSVLDFVDPQTIVVWVPQSPGIAELFGRVLVFEDGVVVQDGAPEALKNSPGPYRQLMETR